MPGLLSEYHSVQFCFLCTLHGDLASFVLFLY